MKKINQILFIIVLPIFMLICDIQVCSAQDTLNNTFIIRIKLFELAKKRVANTCVKINNTCIPIVDGEYKIPFVEKLDFDSLNFYKCDKQVVNSEPIYCRFRNRNTYYLEYNICGDYFMLGSLNKIDSKSKEKPTVKYRVTNFWGLDTIAGFDRFTQEDVLLHNNKWSRKVVLENYNHSAMCTGGIVSIGIKNKSKKKLINDGDFNYIDYQNIVNISYFPLHPKLENLLFEYDFNTKRYSLKFKR